jgi:glycosyltransferase involved in cell wall biosynthesis
VVWLPHPVPVAVRRTPYVLTLHDLSWVQRPADFTRYERLWHRAARPAALARGAARVVAVSAATRAAAVAQWKLDPEQVTVIRSGVSAPTSSSGGAPPAGLAKGYLLCVGGLEPRKDPELLVEAHARARKEGLDAELVFVGEGRLAPRLAGRPGVRLLGVVDDDELDRLYRGALALVQPSRLEGYGLPPLEALARETPSIVADLEVYDETVGAAALRFPPGDAAALAAALTRVGAERERLLAAAPQVPSWRDAAVAFRAVLARATSRS